MKRQLSRREKTLLLVFAVLLLFFVYYVAVDQPVRSSIEQSQSRLSAAQSQLSIDTVKLSQMQRMQADLAELSSDSAAVVPDYDNARQVVELLNSAMLYADSYDMSFRAVVINDPIILRPIDISFVCTDYSTAERILNVLYAGPYRCELSQALISENDPLGAEAPASVAYGSVKVSFTVTFFEFIPQQ